MSTTTRTIWLATAIALLTAAGCEEKPLTGGGAGKNGATFGAEGAPEFLDVGFEVLHPIFLKHKIAPGPKAALWAERYHRRWVRWTGKIRSFTANGITLKQLPVTSTFDVSLWVDNNQRQALRARYKLGDLVTYVGRLDSYDDVWRTLYLVNGAVIGPAVQQDLGL